MMAIREFLFTDDDYAAYSAMQREVYPEYPFSPAEIRHEDDSWDSGRFVRWRALIDGAGWAQMNHSRHSFVPDTYWLDFGVIPGARRRGRGTALYEAALDAVRRRGAKRLRSGAKESMSDGVAFLLKRGWVETKRDLERSADDPTFLWQGLTGVRRDARGKGIAMALKLETVRYARELGVEHIKTWNDQRNRPMLRINEAMGFVKQPAWIAYQKDL